MRFPCKIFLCLASWGSNQKRCYKRHVYPDIQPILLMFSSKIVSEYDQEIPQSQNADNLMARWGSALLYVMFSCVFVNFPYCVLGQSVIVLCFVVRYFISNLVLQSSWWGRKSWSVLLNLSSWCLVMVEWLFLAVSLACLRFVIVVFPDHTHYFWYLIVLIPDFSFLS